VKIIITDLQLDPFTKRPVYVTITIFDQLGREQLRASLPVRMFNGELAVGAELTLTPKA